MDAELLRAALEEYIRMGPETRRPAAERLGERAPAVAPAARDAALREAKRAVAAAEALAREHVQGRRTQPAAEAELRRRVPWLDALGDGGDLAKRLGNYGFFLAIH